MIEARRAAGADQARQVKIKAAFPGSAEFKKLETDGHA
jgi:hypothetical protein